MAGVSTSTTIFAAPMRRILIVISILFMSTTFMAFSVLIYKVPAAASIVLAEEENPHDDAPAGKDTGKDGSDKMVTFHQLALATDNSQTKTFFTHIPPCCTNGFADKPYTPPEVI